MLDSFAQFRKLENCVDEVGAFPCLRNEGFVTWRNNVRVTRACTISCVPVFC